MHSVPAENGPCMVADPEVCDLKEVQGAMVPIRKAKLA